MIAYRKERIENTLLYFTQEHYKKTGKYITPPALRKYLLLFEFTYLKETGDMPLELKYFISEKSPVEIEEDITEYQSIKFELYRKKDQVTSIVKPAGYFDPDYFATAELELMEKLIIDYSKKFTNDNIEKDVSHAKIKAWKAANSSQKTAQNPIKYLNPDDMFDKKLNKKSEDDLTNAEYRHRMNTSIRNFCLSKKSA